MRHRYSRVLPAVLSSKQNESRYRRAYDWPLLEPAGLDHDVWCQYDRAQDAPDWTYRACVQSESHLLGWVWGVVQPPDLALSCRQCVLPDLKLLWPAFFR